jgi:SAM-dependent methyltransferase
MAYLARSIGAGTGRVVLDLAAGTGKLTRALRAFGPQLIAVEPSDGMRRVFASVVAGVPVYDGTAEAIPLADKSVDAVVVGQAFHWFRTEAALREIARVMRPGGALGLIWNRRDERVPWVAHLGAMINSRDRRGAPDSKDERWTSAFDGQGPFGPLEHRSFRFVQPLSPDGVVERVLSISFLATVPKEEQRSIASAVRSLLASTPETVGRAIVEFPYTTDVYVARLG